MKDEGRKVLVVEPDAQQRKELQHALATSGYQVGTAATWRDAVERAGTSRPDLAVVDASDESFASICGHPMLRDVPVIALSGEYCDRAIASEAGCAVCLTKPVRPQDLARRIGQEFERRSSSWE